MLTQAQPTPSPASTQPSSRAVRLGLIGCGSIAVGSHIPAIIDTEGVELVAVLDPHPEPPAMRRASLHLPEGLLHQTIDRFYAAELDAVVVTSPAPMHRANVVEAVSRGVPVLCEKPLAMDAHDAAEMVAAADRAGVSLHAGFCYRFSPVAKTIRDVLRSGAIGEPRTLRLIYNWACHGAAIGTEADEPLRWQSDARRRGRMLEGGPMVDCGTHQIDLARWWLGSEVQRVRGHGSWADGFDAPDHVWSHLDHANGAHTVVEMSFSYGHRCRDLPKEFVYEVIGTEGVVRYDRIGRVFECRDRHGTQPLPFGGEKGFQAMYAAWTRLLREKVSDDRLCEGRDAVRVTEIAREATQQAIDDRLVAAEGTEFDSSPQPIGAR